MVSLLGKTPEQSTSFSSPTSTMTVQVPLKSILKRPIDDRARMKDFMSGDGDGDRFSQTQQPDHLSSLDQSHKHNVRFHKTILNRRIPHLNNMSQQLREAVWIQPDEYLEIRQRCIFTLRIMAMGEASVELMESEDFCPRGLEGKTREGILKRREYKLESIHAVLEEQQILWNEEIDDDEAIMESYQVFSIPCAEDAYERGALDELAIQDYLMEEQCNSCKLSPTVCGHSPMQNITNVLFMHVQRVALLTEIEKNFYEESSIERRRKCEEACSYKEQHNNLLTKSLRAFFSERLDTSKDSLMGSMETNVIHQDDDLPSLTWDEEDSSNCGSLSVSEASTESFTPELSDVFHSRKKHQSLTAEKATMLSSLLLFVKNTPTSRQSPTN
jgi:hypothetical protein